MDTTSRPYLPVTEKLDETARALAHATLEFAGGIIHGGAQTPHALAVHTLAEQLVAQALTLDGFEPLIGPADQVDAVYRERAHLLALLATIYPAVLTPCPAPEPAPVLGEDGWHLLYLQLAGRQLSWHIRPRDTELFHHVERVSPDDERARWDGHTTTEKYATIRRMLRREESAPLPLLRGVHHRLRLRRGRV